MIPLRVRGLLARPGLRVFLAVLTAFLLIPTTWTGLIIDDYFQRLAVEGKLGYPLALTDLFSFMAKAPAQRAWSRELGLTTWWFPDDAQVSYFRPLAAFTHVLDYRYIPDAAWWMHVENLAWYGALVVACGWFYTRFLPSAALGTWVAGLALFFYALDHAHATPVAWIANRNALMAMLFGLLAFAAHVRAREGGRDPRGRAGYVVLSSALLGIALFSGESAVAIMGYFVAYAALLERGDGRRRAVSLLPAIVTVLAWRLVYRSLGYGIVGSGISSDPLLDTAGFVRRALETWPLILITDIVAVPSDLLVAAPRFIPVVLAVTLLFLAALAYVLWPLVRRSRTVAFLALGTLLSTLPFGATIATDRYVFWTGLGLMGLLAELVASVTLGGVRGGPDARDLPRRGALQRRLTVSLAWVCLVMRGIASPLFFPIRAAGPAILNDGYERFAASLPSGPDVREKTVVIVDSPFDLMTAFVPVVRMGMRTDGGKGGGVAPGHQYLLHAGVTPIDVTREGPRTLVVDSPRGWLPNPVDRTMRGTPFRVGERVSLERMQVEVLDVLPDGRASRVRFTFAVPLEDPSLVVVRCGNDGYEPFALPAVGQTVHLEKPPLTLRTK